MKLLLSSLAVLGLSGCAILGPPPSRIMSSDQVLATYRPYAFRPISELIPRLGAPRGQTMIGASKVYLWESETNLAAIVPRSQPIPLHCELQVFVDANEVIQNVFLNGNDGACQNFAL